MALHSVAGCLLLTYIELYCPSPQDPEGTHARLQDRPVRFDLDIAARRLGVTRRTLYVTLCVLAGRWIDEDARGRAARAGREFFVPQHGFNGSIKFYSVTGPFTYRAGTVLFLRRNRPVLQSVLEKAGFTRDFSLPTLHMDPNEGSGAPTSTPDRALENLPKREALGDIMLRASVLAGDRRSERWPRLRNAVERGLAGPEVIKVKPKRSS